LIVGQPEKSRQHLASPTILLVTPVGVTTQKQAPTIAVTEAACDIPDIDSSLDKSSARPVAEAMKVELWDPKPIP